MNEMRSENYSGVYSFGFVTAMFHHDGRVIFDGLNLEAVCDFWLLVIRKSMYFYWIEFLYGRIYMYFIC